jgi:hypothetical protein
VKRASSGKIPREKRWEINKYNLDEQAENKDGSKKAKKTNSGWLNKK